MKCSSCGKEITGRYHKFDVGNRILNTCVSCVKKAKTRLGKLKYRTIEEDSLYKELKRVLIIN